MKFSLSVTKVPNTSTLDQQWLMIATYGDAGATGYFRNRDDAWDAGAKFLQENDNA